MLHNILQTTLNTIINTPSPCGEGWGGVFLSLDYSLMSFLNFDGGGILDFLMYWFSYKWTLVPVYALILFALWKKCAGWKPFLITLVTIALVVTCCDQLSSHLIKPWVSRLRPSHDPLIMDQLHYVNDYRSGLYGFVSSHAANTCGVAVMLWQWFKSNIAKALLVLWVSLTCYSRIYLGVHFPGDILGGLAVGLLVGFAFAYLHNKYCHRLNQSPQS